MVLMLSAAGVGLLCYFLGEAKQRRAFLEAKKSLEVKMLIEEQSAEQVSRGWKKGLIERKNGPVNGLTNCVFDIEILREIKSSLMWRN